MNFKTIVFLLIVGVVLMMLGNIFELFGFLSMLSFCGAGILFLVWLYKKFFNHK